VKLLRTTRRKLIQFLIRDQRDAGMSTAEYAVGILAAVAFAMVLYKVVTSDAVSSALGGIVHRALEVSF
jgi:Flp pilus assembly pilin Flp